LNDKKEQIERKSDFVLFFVKKEQNEN